MSETTFQQAAKAVESGDLAELRQLLQSTPELVAETDEEGNNLLVLACRAATSNMALPPRKGTDEQHRAVSLILDAGANPSAANHAGWAPLHMTAMTGHQELTRRLLEAGASKEGHLMGARGGSPLSLALFYTQTEMGTLLADPEPEPGNLRNAAALGRELEEFFQGDTLTEQAIVGLDFYRPSEIFPEWERNYQTQEVLDEALSWASRNGQCESLSLLVKRGARVNSSAYRWNSAGLGAALRVRKVRQSPHRRRR